jgi:hypothetical protein
MNERSGFRLIPLPARVAAAVVFTAIVGWCQWVFHGSPVVGFGTVIGLAGGTLLAGTILLAGYVYADAGRRGMPPVPWTALALLVPNGIGFVLYFLLRRPIARPCPACGFPLPAEAAFCLRCGRRQVTNQPEDSAA